MNEFLKYLSDALRRTYGSVVERPMPWNMIDKLASLEERCETDHGEDRDDQERAKLSNIAPDEAGDRKRST